MNDKEYDFLVGGRRHISNEEYYTLGQHCYAEGWIDDFGCMTPKGNRVVADYERSLKKRNKNE